MNKIYITIVCLLLLFIYSCQKENEVKINQNNKIQIEKIEIICSEKNQVFFKIISKEGYTDKDKNIVYLKDIKAYLFKDKKLFYEIKSDKAKYLKNLNQIIVYSANGFNYKDKLKFTSSEIIFKQKEKEVIFKNIFINYSKNQIKGQELILDKNFNELKIKNVKAFLF